jgi:leukotriene-A4 hydrolase
MSMNRRQALAALSATALVQGACRRADNTTEDSMINTDREDPHSFSQPQKVRVRHVALDLKVSFEQRKLSGAAELDIARVDKTSALILDTRDLVIHHVESGDANGNFRPAKWMLGRKDPILGSPLTIELPQAELPEQANRVRITYESVPTASGLQWLDAGQTGDKKQPFLFSQNESIHARSWIPLQDSPGVRITYTVRIGAPKNLLALMSADQKGAEGGAHRFAMELPVPPYLIALAVGGIAFAATGPRTGVYAEPSMLARAAREFEDTEKLVEAVERLYGPYRWGRYDLLVLPPSFPFGGMENPRLTFATPTVIAGDKSLVGLVSHELAHSWSGNLVTNATWSDFWLNEGFTTYIENRIQEAVYGREQALMEQVLARRELDHELATFDKRDQILHIDLKGRDPDDGTTEVPYIKGALFLRQIEETFSRPAFDAFLKRYFDHFAFQSITTATALTYLQRELFDKHPELAAHIPVHEWVYEPGLPPSAPKAVSERLEAAAKQARDWASGKLSISEITSKQWSTQEWLEFLQVLPEQLSREQMGHLDKAFHLTGTGNDEILDQWLKMVVKANYQPAYPRLKAFLMEVGRMKMIRPLYSELMKTPDGTRFAREVYAQARSGYHPIAQTAVDKIVGRGLVEGN